MAKETEGRQKQGGAGWFGLGPRNWYVLGAALAVIVLGYYLLGRGSVTAAPMLLVLGYAVLVPTGLLLGYRRRTNGGAE